MLIGEMHGTWEYPRLVGRLAELAVDRGLPVLVGLEIPMTEQPAIDAYVTGASPDAPTGSSFWHRDPRHDDGRAGEALAELLATLRAAAGRGRVQVCAFDTPWGEEGTIVPPEQVPLYTTPRDQVMADNLTQAVERAGGPDGLCTLVLAGNIHTRISRYPDVDEPHLGEMLAERFPGVMAWDGHWTGGRIRASMGPDGVGVHPLAPRHTAAGSIGRYGSVGEVNHHGHHGWINVGTLTPSISVAL